MSDSTFSDITDEELAEMERGHEEWGNLAGHAFCKFCWPTTWPCRTARLIVALRAGREEVIRLREQYEEVCLTITEG